MTTRFQWGLLPFKWSFTFDWSCYFSPAYLTRYRGLNFEDV
jgi:hypothetical protein